MIHQSHTERTGAALTHRATYDTHQAANATTGTEEGIGTPPPFRFSGEVDPIRLDTHQATESRTF